MIPYAAIDLREGQVVQLVGGDPRAERIRWSDPAGIARRWQEAGFRALHVVDLDAALGTGSNRSAIEAILAECTAEVQVGGGVRDQQAARALLEAGATRVVVGTRAITDRAWLVRLVDRYPHRVVVAADSLRGEVAIRGWTESAGITVESLIAEMADLPLAAVLVTDVSREGRLEGVDADLFRRLCECTEHPIQASGGISGLDDLRELNSAGASGAVLGMSLYTGAIDPVSVNQEFGR